jgi:hypothetical protein
MKIYVTMFVICKRGDLDLVSWTYQDEDEGDEELDSEGLSDWEMFIDRGHTETGSTANLFRSEKLEKDENSGWNFFERFRDIYFVFS